MTGARIFNVDILDDSEPVIFVQRYEFPNRVFQVFRKPETPDEPFRISAGVTIDRELYWGILPFVFDAPTGDKDELPEVFALIYLDEQNPPSRNQEQASQNGADPYAVVVYDAEAQTYRCEASFTGYDALENIAAPSLEAEIQMVALALYDLLQKSR